MDLGAYTRVYYTYVLLRDPRKNMRMRVCNDGDFGLYNIEIFVAILVYRCSICTADPRCHFV